MPYPGPFLEPGITKRIKRTAFLRSLARPDKKRYREGAKLLLARQPNMLRNTA